MDIIEYKYNSKLAPMIRAFVDEKRASGYKYNNEAKFLAAFDRWLCEDESRDNGELSRAVVIAWCRKRPTESFTSRAYRVFPVRMLGKYLVSLGYNAYIAMRFKIFPRDLHYIPSFEQLGIFLTYVDTTLTDKLLSSQRGKNPNKVLQTHCLAAILPVIFRLYITMGFRLNEATHLRHENLDICTGKMLVDVTKGDKHRYVIFTPELIDLVQRSTRKLNQLGIYSPWLFPNALNPDKNIQGYTISSKFRHAWLECFPDSTDENTPKIQGLRHCFVIYRIARWCLSGQAVEKLIPYLSAHLGHKSVNETYDYFHQIEHLIPAAVVYLKRNMIFRKESYEFVESAE